MNKDIEKKILLLYEKTSSELPKDVSNSLLLASKKETGIAKQILKDMIKNTDIAKNKKRPLCQDTGTPIFYLKVYEKITLKEVEQIKRNIIRATKTATKNNILRPNAVDSISGRNTGTSVGKGIPEIHIASHKKKSVIVELMLKGGGCENVGAQYKLPNSKLNAGRDLDGVKKCILNCAFNAQGKGCSPGIFGICIGGSRNSGMETAKKQLFRKLNDESKNKTLAKMEKELYDDINKLGIGPMGLGGKTTTLGVKIGTIHRIPASYFVSISYMCWSMRRQKIEIKL